MKNHNQEEMALTSTTRHKGKFKGTCRTCGKYGHKSAQCYHNSDNTTPNQVTAKTKYYKTKDKCTYCNIMGHKEEDCYKKKRDNKTNGASPRQHTVLTCKYELYEYTVFTTYATVMELGRYKRYNIPVKNLARFYTGIKFSFRFSQCRFTRQKQHKKGTAL